MSARKRVLAAAVAALAIGSAAWWMLRPAPETAAALQGWVEGQLVHIAAEEAGRIERLNVEAGDTVAAGDTLATLESSMQTAQRDEAAARLAQARAVLANLSAAQQRPEQIAILEAQEERARATLDLSRAEHLRHQELFRRGISAKARLDQAEMAFERDKAALGEVERQIRAAALAGRAGDIDAARAAVEAGEAALAHAESRLAKRRLAAPAGGRVEDVFFRAGEVVTAGQPILALLPPGNLRLRFYVPEPLLSAFPVGARVAVSCDGCEAFAGTVSFVAREAEYTPPVIFSDKERHKLVFRAEARPAGETRLPVGLPVGVRPGAAVTAAGP